MVASPVSPQLTPNIMDEIENKNALMVASLAR